MNRELILEVADAIEQLGRGEPVGPMIEFDMQHWSEKIHDKNGYCGTVGCIAGVTCAVLLAKGELTDIPPDVENIAARALERNRTSRS